MPKRISIKESLERAMTEQSNPDGAKGSIGNDPFDQSAVTEAIMGLMKERKGDGKLYLALLSNLQKVEGESITIGFENEEELKNAEPFREGIERRLAERLNNSSLSLHFILSEAPPDGKKERRLFTGRDKVAYFEEKNPEVANLIRTLSLELE